MHKKKHNFIAMIASTGKKSLSLTLLLLVLLRLPTWAQQSFGEPEIPWASGEVPCPAQTTTWVHPDDADTMETTVHCIDDPAKLLPGERCYYMFVPECAVDFAPMVVVLHGRTGCPAEADAKLRWGKLSKSECFVVIYPWGATDFDLVSTSCWARNGGLQPGLFQQRAGPCCCDKTELGIRLPVVEFKTKDEVFVRNAIQDAVSKSSVSINTKRIYMAGHSNGSLMGLGFAIQNSDLIAAVGVHSAILNEGPPKFTYDAVPIWMVHGLLDEDFPYGPYDSTGLGVFSTLGKEKEVEFLGNLNNCDGNVIRDESTWGDDAFSISRTNCENEADVTLLTVRKAGHFPILGVSADEVKEDIAGVEETMIDTTKLAWDFMKKYSKSSDPNLGKIAIPELVPSSFILFFVSLFVPILRLFDSIGSFIGGFFGG